MSFNEFCTEHVRSQPENLYLYRGFFALVALISFLSLISIVVTMQSHTKLQQHPSFLIACICLIEAINSYISLVNVPQLTSTYFICYFENIFVNLLRYTFFEAKKLEEVYQLLVLVNEIIFDYFQHVSLVLNMCLCHDLIQTLKNPFEVGRSRVWKYILVSGFVPFLFISSIWLTTQQQLPTIYYQPSVYGNDDSMTICDQLVKKSLLPLDTNCTLP